MSSLKLIAELAMQHFEHLISESSVSIDCTGNRDDLVHFLDTENTFFDEHKICCNTENIPDGFQNWGRLTLICAYIIL